MPDIKPFKGIIYDKRRVEIANVVAPPYDVISPQFQSTLYERSPYNVVRLILNRESNPYIAAGRDFGAWRKEGILVQDEHPSIYILSQSFCDREGNDVERWGFIAACKLEDIGKGSIYPHEMTHAAPREDRFRLFQSTHAMFSQIFGLYSDPERTLDDAIRSVHLLEPYADVTFEGIRSRIWRLVDERHAGAMISFLRDQKVLIADGHHRYETALVYRDSMRLKNPYHEGMEPYNFVPMFFTNMHDPGLIIYPTHRLIHSLPTYRQEALIKGCRRFFTITEHSTDDELLNGLRGQTRWAFGVAVANPYRRLLLQAKEKIVRDELAGLSHALADLDVSLLHTVIMKNILGMDEEAQEKKLNLHYEKDARLAIESVRTGKSQAAFIMNPPRIEQVRAVASAGMVMPQKSTFFHPKLLSGLVMYSFEGRDKG